MPTRVKPDDVVAELAVLGHYFCFNQCEARVEFRNGDPLTDEEMSVIRHHLRRKGLYGESLIWDAIVSEAMRDQYHPIKDFLKLVIKNYDGKPHIEKLASYFKDTDGVFPLYLRKWLIGSIGKILASEQNPVLVLDGEQGIGKSKFVDWLCPQTVKTSFVSSPVFPDDKDCRILLGTKWIWEIAELGSTTKKADRELLKHFLSLERITVRLPYGKRAVDMPAQASFIGTVNDEYGVLNDPTGSRRFRICHIDEIDWRGYVLDMDIQQVWGEAYDAYIKGESVNLKSDQEKKCREINERYEMDDAVEGLLKRYYQIDSTRLDWWEETSEIVEALFLRQGHTRANTVAVGACCRRLKLKRVRRQQKNGQQVWGFTGLERI